MPKQQSSREQMYEVLVAPPGRHQTVRRVVAASEADARKAVQDEGVQPEHIVQAEPPTAA